LTILFVIGNQAFAVENAMDVVPAGTLLLPYFEVDLNNESGVTTLFSVNNASAAPQLAHITFWTDQSRPTLDFTIYLTGYDVFTMNIGQLFRTGGLPFIGGPKEPPSQTDEDAGDFSLAFSSAIPGEPDAVDVGESSACTFPLPASIPGTFLTFIREAHTGLPISGNFAEQGRCGGFRYGDGLARGYVTIDNVRTCSTQIPSSPGYFNTILKGAHPDVSDEDLPPGNANVLWGDFFYVNSAENFAQGDTLIHVEAYRSPEPLGPLPFGTPYTFYGRYNAFTRIDNREPLATVWGVRYINGGAFTGGSDILCWRDTAVAESANYYNCAIGPGSTDGQPLGQNQLVIFDEEENPVVVETPPFSPTPIGDVLTPCPWEATRTGVGGNNLPSPFSFGWLYLNLNTTNPLSDYPGSGNPFTAPQSINQSWVGVVMDASGRFSVGYSGMHFDNATDPNNVCIGFDGFVGPCGL
jgi:hypothetical protein